ncbi:hypothetical protein GALL_527260 [mine drainage metagenome]|uniref:Uncharacterized protein n=1 Tax=mine drainage metagenome TaxID=410659 RepID=A0A1J5P2C7_9ZZZZ
MTALSGDDNNSTGSRSELDSLLKGQQKINDKIAQAIRKTEKRLMRAHFILGELILSDPELNERVRPLVESYLSKLGPKRQLVDHYTPNRDLLDRLRAMMR